MTHTGNGPRWGVIDTLVLALYLAGGTAATVAVIDEVWVLLVGAFLAIAVAEFLDRITATASEED